VRRRYTQARVVRPCAHDISSPTLPSAAAAAAAAASVSGWKPGRPSGKALRETTALAPQSQGGGGGGGGVGWGGGDLVTGCEGKRGRGAGGGGLEGRATGGEGMRRALRRGCA
jgi:hypothetical protein